MSTEDWTRRAGYEVTPSNKSRKGLTTEAFNTKPVNPFSNPEPKKEEPVDDAIDEVKDIIEPAFKKEEEARLTNTPLKSVSIRWQECQFKVKFDEVLIQKSELTSWMMLVHDLGRDPEGPPWSPPVSEQPQSFVIEFEGKKTAVSYFDHQIQWQNYLIFSFMIIAPEVQSPP